MLNQAWPLEACRLFGMRLQNMRDRKRDKGVRICPNVELSEVHFLEPPEESGGITNSHNFRKREPQPIIQQDNQDDAEVYNEDPQSLDSNEGKEDVKVMEKFDDDNMDVTTVKIIGAL